jgi:selenocysteine-specific elongation factor
MRASGAAAAPADPQRPRARVVVGTAGHIDHGKTLLVKALTGIDCDRWAEEKARGITIDLGFAHLSEGDLQIGFVDVPGHDRFVHNAVAGLGGIRIMLLVVAADRGVMPQTREHLAICSLLGIPGALVALTKADLATADLLELAELEIAELLGPTPFAGAPIVQVSSVTGAGLAELRRQLLELGARFAVPFAPALPARLPVDRAFHLRGLGVVVTGTLASGAVAVGDELEVLPGGHGVRVRDVQVHGSRRSPAAAGERTSLQLAGAALGVLGRGAQLATPGALATTVTLCSRFTLLGTAPQALSRQVAVRLHHFAAEVLGTLRPLAPRRLEPGESGVVELQLAKPIAAVRGDRFILRRPSPQTTLGGGWILDPQWRRRRGERLATALGALAADDRQALLLWVDEAGERGAAAAALGRRLGRDEGLAGELAALAAEGRLRELPDPQARGGRWLAAGVFERVAARAERALGSYFQRDPLAQGMPRAEAVRRIVPAVSAALAQVYLSWLEERGVLTVRGDLVALPGRRVELAAAVAALAAAIEGRLAAAELTPPPPEQLRGALAAAPGAFEAALRHLVQSGALARLPNGTLITAASLAAVRQQLQEPGWERFSVGQFKERFGLSRKYAMPILEHLDAVGITRRAGDDRLVAKSG